jgi:hypothetical protein
MMNAAMSKSVTVLSVPHQLQGSLTCPGYIYDPLYPVLIEDMIRGGVDFVFEEAGSHNPTTAESLANSILGQGRYLNIDPTWDERSQYGIATAAGYREIGDPEEALASGCPPDILQWNIVAEQEKREDVWLQRILARPFTKGLVICGIAHNLSFTFRLTSVEIHTVKTYLYIPCHKLCTRPHTKGNEDEQR